MGPSQSLLQAIVISKYELGRKSMGGGVQVYDLFKWGNWVNFLFIQVCKNPGCLPIFSAG
jgi:hypothetical protein